MIVVTGYIKIASDQFERARPYAQGAGSDRREPGCILYAYAEDVLEPGTIRIVERWSDWASSMPTAIHRTSRIGARS